MIFKDRLQYIDQCIAGEKIRFQKLLSIEVFNSFDRGYEIFRDYIRQKNNISDVSCDVDKDNLILHLKSNSTLEDLLMENFPKRGVIPIQTNSGVDLQIKLVEDVFSTQGG